eukprot:477315-Karenia_brevis.AAC.1
MVIVMVSRDDDDYDADDDLYDDYDDVGNFFFLSSNDNSPGFVFHQQRHHVRSAGVTRSPVMLQSDV